MHGLVEDHEHGGECGEEYEHQRLHRTVHPVTDGRRERVDDNTLDDGNHCCDQSHQRRRGEHQRAGVRPVVGQLADQQGAQSEDAEDGDQLGGGLDHRRDPDRAGGHHPRGHEPVEEPQEARDDRGSVQRRRIAEQRTLERDTDVAGQPFDDTVHTGDGAGAEWRPLLISRPRSDELRLCRRARSAHASTGCSAIAHQGNLTVLGGGSSTPGSTENWNVSAALFCVTTTFAPSSTGRTGGSVRPGHLRPFHYRNSRARAGRCADPEVAPPRRGGFHSMLSERA